MIFTPRLEKAITVAARAHREQTRKGSDIPYIIHPFSVMAIAGEVTSDEDTLIACLFHDIIEDVPEEYSEARMRQEFGDRVTDIVRGVTKDDTLGDWYAVSKGYLQHLELKASDESVIVSAADKTHNLMSVLADYDKMGDEVWQKFSTKSADDQLWWYQSVLEVITKRQAPQLLIDKLSSLITELQTKLVIK